MDNLVFVCDEDIHLIDEDDYDDDSCMILLIQAGLKKRRLLLNTNQRSQVKQRQRLLREYIEDLYRYLDVDLRKC